MQREVGITFVYVTHDQEEAFSMSDRVAIMHRGRIEQIGDPVRCLSPAAARCSWPASWAPRTVSPRASSRRCREGRYRVDMGTLGTLDVPGVAGLAVGDQAVAVVRPEAIRTAAGFGDAVLDGTVTDVSYIGPQTQYVVDAGGLGTAAMLSPADDDDLLHSGAARVSASLHARPGWCRGSRRRSTAPNDVLAARAVRPHRRIWARPPPPPTSRWARASRMSGAVSGRC